MKTQAEELWDLLIRSKRAYAFTGAGVSTLSGIRDFRGSNGVYNKPWHGLSVEEILSLDCFLEHPEYFYEWALEFIYCMGKYKPSIVHTTLAALEKRGMIRGVYTQNIDILHQAAGSKNVWEVHGSAAMHHCLKCHAAYSYAEIEPTVLAHKVPHCLKCGGLVKPDIIFYGENLNESLLDQAFRDMGSSDFVMVLGSSLTVQPAASLPAMAVQSGARLAIVNAQPTTLDSRASILLEDLEQTFQILSAKLKKS